MSTLCLGLIGGLEPSAAVYYYDRLVNAHADRNHAPRLLISHADKHAVLRAVSNAETVRLASYFAAIGNKLAKAGAQFAAIASVRAHMCAPQLHGQLRIPFLDITDAISDFIDERRLKRVALFGTRLTTETGLFGRVPDVVTVHPTAHEIECVHSIYVRIAAAQRATSRDVDELARIARRLSTEERADAVLLAGTAFSLIADSLPPDVPFVDCARVHVDAIMAALSAG